MRIIVLGCGAIGSWVSLFLADSTHEFFLFDDDTVERENIGTSAYRNIDVGKKKVTALSRLLWDAARCRAYPNHGTLSSDAQIRPSIIYEETIAIDCFDNSDARALSMGLDIPVLHVGVSGPEMGASIWDIHYQLHPSPPRGEDTFCTHMAGRAILRHTASLAANLVLHYINTGEKVSRITRRFCGVDVK